MAVQFQAEMWGECIQGDATAMAMWAAAGQRHAVPAPRAIDLQTAALMLVPSSCMPAETRLEGGLEVALRSSGR